MLPGLQVNIVNVVVMFGETGAGYRGEIFRRETGQYEHPVQKWAKNRGSPVGVRFKFCPTFNLVTHFQ